MSTTNMRKLLNEFKSHVNLNEAMSDSQQKNMLVKLSKEIEKKFPDMEASTIDREQDSPSGDNGWTVAFLDDGAEGISLYTRSDGTFDAFDMGSGKEWKRIKNINDFKKIHDQVYK